MKKLLAAAALACVFTMPAHAVTTVFSDNFNSNSADVLNGTPAGWSLISGTTDIIGNGGVFDWYPGNGSYIDLDGSSGDLGQNTLLLSNTIGNYIGGRDYKFSFDYGINHNDGSDTDQIVMGLYLFRPFFC
jgi:hypothetical protein